MKIHTGTRNVNHFKKEKKTLYSEEIKILLKHTIKISLLRLFQQENST